MVKFGVSLSSPQRSTEYSLIRKITLECDRLGYDYITLNDHINETILECWTTLSHLAAETKKLRLVANVMCNLYRYPSLLAKMAATLDVLSDGRLDLGIGAGWVNTENVAYGIPFPKHSVRLAMLEEGVRLIKKMWTGEKTSFDGKYYTLRNAVCDPKPIQKPHPPIWIGGMSDKLLKIVAEIADTWDFFNLSEEEYSRKLGILEKYCSITNRNPADIQKSSNAEIVIAANPQQLEEKIQKFKPKEMSESDYRSTFLRIVGTPDECVKRLKWHSNLGITFFRLRFPDLLEMKLEPLELFAKHVIPAFK